MEYGIQLYSVRDITEKNLEYALQQVSEIGYKSVEFAGFFGHSQEEIKDMLKKYNLKVSGTHTSLSELVDDFEKTVAYHKAIGNTNIIIPSAELDCQEKVDKFIDQVNRLQPELEKEGITLLYHNHDFEFIPNKDGSIAYDQIISKTKLMLELDTYWVYAAKQDPIKMMEVLKDRIRFIHIKDGNSSGHGAPLGQGTAPVSAVYEKAVSMGIPMVVESETLQPDGLTEVKICFNYLKELS